MFFNIIIISSCQEKVYVYQRDVYRNNEFYIHGLI